jgi:hypothetical protein
MRDCGRGVRDLSNRGRGVRSRSDRGGGGRNLSKRGRWRRGLSGQGIVVSMHREYCCHEDSGQAAGDDDLARIFGVHIEVLNLA